MYMAELGIGAVPRGCDQESIHSLMLSAVGGSASAAGASFCGSGPRHVGHVCCFLSQVRTQSSWKTWLHGNLTAISSATSSCECKGVNIRESMQLSSSCV